MRALALDSAFGGISAAVAEGQAVLAVRHGEPGAKAAESLPGLAADVLAQAGVGLADLERIAVTLGPGGFTALRAGIAFAKGLAFGAGKPLLGFTTLEALAVSAPRGAGPIAAIIDAKRDEVFLQVFSAELSPLTDAMVVSLDALPNVFEWPPAIRACGSGTHFLRERAASGIVDLGFSGPDAAALAIHCQSFAPGARLAQAVYLRPADARPMA